MTERGVDVRLADLAERGRLIVGAHPALGAIELAEQMRRRAEYVEGVKGPKAIAAQPRARRALVGLVIDAFALAAAVDLDLAAAIETALEPKSEETTQEVPA